MSCQNKNKVHVKRLTDAKTEIGGKIVEKLFYFLSNEV